MGRHTVTARLIANPALGAREAAGTRHLQPSAPDRLSGARDKQLMKHLHYESCSEDAAHPVEMYALLFWSFKNASPVQLLDGISRSWKQKTSGPYAYDFPSSLVFKQQGRPKRTSPPKTIKLRTEESKLTCRRRAGSPTAGEGTGRECYFGRAGEPGGRGTQGVRWGWPAFSGFPMPIPPQENQPAGTSWQLWGWGSKGQGVGVGGQEGRGLSEAISVSVLRFSPRPRGWPGRGSGSGPCPSAPARIKVAQRSFTRWKHTQPSFLF